VVCVKEFIISDKYHLQVLQFRFNGTVAEANANQHISDSYATPNISHQVAEKHEPKRKRFFKIFKMFKIVFD